MNTYIIVFGITYLTSVLVMIGLAITANMIEKFTAPELRELGIEILCPGYNTVIVVLIFAAVIAGIEYDKSA